MPAWFIWMGGASSGDPTAANNAGNWFTNATDHNLPQPGDDLVWLARPNMQPGDSEGGGSPGFGQLYNCIGFSGGPYNSMVIPDFYAATITFSNNVQTGDFRLGGPIPSNLPSGFNAGDPGGASGTIDQQGSDLTSTGFFQFLKGTLHTPGTTATEHIRGSGLIAPENEGGVTTAANYSIENAAVLTMKAGTVTVTSNDQEFDVNDGCGMAVDPANAQSANVVTSPGLTLTTKVNVQPGAWLEVRSGTYHTKLQ